MIQIQGLANKTGKQYWRSLNELAGKSEFKEWFGKEFADGAADQLDSGNRRHFLQIMAASLGLAGLTACRRPVEKILPYAKSFQGLVHGKSSYYATVMTLGAQAFGVVAESYDGRPIKIEGNKNHPTSLGAASAWAQASVLNVYDPDRLQALSGPSGKADWAAVQTGLNAVAATGGAGLRILSGAVSSPTLNGLRTSLLAKYPQAKWTEFEAVSDDTILAGSEIAFGDRLRPHYSFSRANVVVSLDSDFLQLDNGGLQWIREFARRRKNVDSLVDAEGIAAAEKARAARHAKHGEGHEEHGEGHGASGHAATGGHDEAHKEAKHGEEKHDHEVAAAKPAAATPAAATGAAAAAVASTPEVPAPTGTNRLYAIESNYTLTGAQADHRLRMRAADVQLFAVELARTVGALAPGLKVLGQAGNQEKVLTAIGKDLQANKGRCLVVAGPRQPAVVHAIVALINQALGNSGETVTYTKDAGRHSAAGLVELSKEISAGTVKSLVILGGNPAYTAPVELDFAAKIKAVPTSIYLGSEKDETAVSAKWNIPESHYLESWGDAVASDGTTAIQQPLIEPLYGDCRSAIEVIGALVEGKPVRGYDVVKATWKLDETTWRKTIHEGVAAGSGAAKLKPLADAGRVQAAVNAAGKPAQGMEVVFFPGAASYDGRFTNNGWLQEAPEPMTKLVWDNAALVSPKTATEMKLEQGDVITIGRNGQVIEAPVMLQPGHADSSITLTLGYGRTEGGRIAKGLGYNAYKLRTAEAQGFATGVTVQKANKTKKLVTTQEHHDQDGRPIARIVSEADFKKDPIVATKPDEHNPELISMFTPYDYTQGNQWGMAIDLQSCIGCNACLVACQSENNIPIVGKDMIDRGREMHWIRLDRYFEGGQEDPQVVYQPLACQQCENAPCESVCPVAATVHSPEGLNDMAYNRCVGTRYCANNCPYKVRRFNYLNWHKDLEEVEKLVFNPDVTVRMRGVMEKCNYCVQRVQEAKAVAKAEKRAAGEVDSTVLPDGAVLTACQQTCPAEAISFGNINNPQSAVAKAKANPRNYVLLPDLNILPRTTYLAKVRNPNPELA